MVALDRHLHNDDGVSFFPVDMPRTLRLQMHLRCSRLPPHIGAHSRFWPNSAWAAARRPLACRRPAFLARRLAMARLRHDEAMGVTRDPPPMLRVSPLSPLSRSSRSRSRSRGTRPAAGAAPAAAADATAAAAAAATDAVPTDAVPPPPTEAVPSTPPPRPPPPRPRLLISIDGGVLTLRDEGALAEGAVVEMGELSVAGVASAVRGSFAAAGALVELDEEGAAVQRRCIACGQLIEEWGVESGAVGAMPWPPSHTSVLVLKHVRSQGAAARRDLKLRAAACFVPLPGNAAARHRAGAQD